jgi:hypothetical protein
MQAAYNDAVSEAAHDRGHGGYTGTIAETDGVTPAVYSAMIAQGASFYTGHDTHNCEKWGPARAIPVAADSDPR